MGRSDAAIRRCCTAVGRRHAENCFATVYLQYPGVIFHQDNARPHTARIAMNCLTNYQSHSWSARSPDLSPIEHIWDMGR
ncbi:hypothetical protein TNCV_1146671 [Trichonephila clavipes]|nr:hypothetical protein TNCV_1146671 [Trichonephila clavipes]